VSAPLNPSGLCMCGCGNHAPVATTNAPRYGVKRGEHRRFIAGHNARKQVHYVVEDRGFVTSCWIWQLSCLPNGYGVGYDEATQRTELAHRVQYRKHVGEIPEGLDLDHLCRIRECCNPSHLEPVTRSENLRRGYAARRRAA
jgi:hypothetical protein